MASLRAFLLALFAILQIVVSLWPGLFGIEGDIGATAEQYRTVLVPAGFAFSIWSVLFAGGLYVAWWHARRRDEDVAAGVGWYAALAFFFTTLWAAHQPVYGPGTISFFLLLPILVFAYLAAWACRDGIAPSRADRVAEAVMWGFSGWITIAAAAGASLALKLGGHWPFLASETASALLLLLLWAPLALFLTYRAAAYAYAGPIVWGLGAIAAAGGAEASLLIALALFILLILAATAAGKRRLRSAT